MSAGRLLLRFPSTCLRALSAPLSRLVVALSLLSPWVMAAKRALAEDFAGQYESKVHAVLEQHCHRCHNDEKKEGGLNLARVKSGKLAVEFDAWPTVAQRILNLEMPPEGEPKLSDEQWRNASKWMQDLIASPENCEQLATDVTQHFYRGHVMSRRLTRSEYNNTLRDLVGLDLKPADGFPADGAGGEGFDTVGDALFTNPILMEKYLGAANRVVEAALPDEVDPSVSPEARAARDRILIAVPSADVPPREAVEFARESVVLSLRERSFVSRSETSTQNCTTTREAARRVLENFARRAYRRAVTADDIDPLLALFDRAQMRGDEFTASLRLALKGALVSPNFLFLIEPEPENEGIYELGSVPLASRLSYFLWASMPDDELLQLAEADKLKDTEVLRAQVRRMIADKHSAGFAESFVAQWLGIDGLGRSVRPDAGRFPEFDDELAQAMKAEVIRFAEHIFREDRSLLDFLDADYTFVNERLAKHYGIADVSGADFRRVQLHDRNRGGLLGMACILTNTSYPLRTSPVLRGRWLLAEVLGDKVPPPPPDVPSLPADDQPTDGLTLRQRLEQHRSKTECASCHSRLDPLGFGLENFDPVGRWRTEIAGQAVDSSGELPGGHKFNGPAELKQALLNRKQEFLRNLTRKVLSYALGRDLNRFDECVVRDTLKALEAGEYRSGILFEQIVLSYPFRHRYAKK